jgi:hypothetical protein
MRRKGLKRGENANMNNVDAYRLLVMLGVLWFAYAPALAGETKSVTLDPTTNNPQPTTFSNVVPQDTVYFNVTVNTPPEYTLDRTEWSRTHNNELFLWVRGAGFNFTLVNSAWQPGNAVARVDAWWNGGGGGGGEGGGPIHRYATGTAEAGATADQLLYVGIDPAIASVGEPSVDAWAYGMETSSRSEFPVKADWTIDEHGYFTTYTDGRNAVRFTRNTAGATAVTATQILEPHHQGSGTSLFVEVASISAEPVMVGIGTWPDFAVVTSPTGHADLVSIAYNPNTPGTQEVVATCGISAKTCTVTVVKVEIIPRSIDVIESLDSGTFTCVVTPDDLNPTYEWLSGVENDAWPESSGNNPQLDYSAPSDSSTIVRNTRWFAPHNDRRQVVDGLIVSYNISCTVTIGSLQCQAEYPAGLNVGVDLAGQCMPPDFSDWESIQVEEVYDLWRVVGQGDFHRTPPIPSVNVPQSSQFYDKAMAHENKHVTQFTSEEPWKDLYDANGLYESIISKLTSDIDEADLRIQIATAVLAQRNIDDQVLVNTKCEREEAAFDAMNDVDPDFLEMDEEDWKPQYGCQ